MKPFYAICLFLLPITQGFAQNYQCLQAGVKHYFLNNNNYLRGIRIDSVRTNGDTTFYYPFHTIRGVYEPGSFYTSGGLDSNGGSWLGKKVAQLSDGTFLFDNFWGDTIVVKPQANVGDSWIFCRDSTSVFYQATIIGSDTMTVLGALDSVKKILITARNPLGILATDPLDSFQIFLSKNNGFVRVFDLYTFPYRAPDTVYIPGFDFYVDYVFSSIGFLVPFIYNPAPAIFSLTSFVNSTYAQLYDWNTGDRFENSVFNSGIPNDGSFPYKYYYDSITSKTVSGASTVYGFSGWMATQHLPKGPSSFFPFFNPSLNYPYDTSNTSGTFSVDNSLLIDSNLMPEERGAQFLELYYPFDTSFCVQSNKYCLIQSFVHGGEASPLSLSYKDGIGLLNYDWNILGGSPPLIQDTTLLYYVKSGAPCGRYVYPNPLNYIEQVVSVSRPRLQIFPNPATSSITIASDRVIGDMTVTDVLGQTLIKQACKNTEETLNINALPPGVYYLKACGDNGPWPVKFVKE